MPLRVIRRKSSGSLTIEGYISLPDGSKHRVRKRAATNSESLAKEEAAALEATILRDAWHGERRGIRRFAEAVNSYLDAEERSPNQQGLVNRMLMAIGNPALKEIDQDTVTAARAKMLRPNVKPRTVTANLITPLRAILNHAAGRGWVDPPLWLKAPKPTSGRTLYLLPIDAERLVANAAPHLKPLLTLLIGVGARMAEALELEWRDVDLVGAKAILWRVKGQSGRRVVDLPPRVVAALANLPHRDGMVFRWEAKARKRKDGAEPSKPRVSDYADHERRYGGQIKTGFAGAVRRAGLNPALTPHDLRHTWASWHYALHKDLLLLQQDGLWSSITLVTRYAHLMPAGQEEAIRRFLGHPSYTAAAPLPAMG